MQGVLHPVEHKYKRTNFFFSLTINFLQMLTDLAFLIPTLGFFHWFIQYGKNVLLKDFVLYGNGLIRDVDDDLSKQ